MKYAGKSIDGFEALGKYRFIHYKLIFQDSSIKVYHFTYNTIVI